MSSVYCEFCGTLAFSCNDPGLAILNLHFCKEVVRCDEHLTASKRIKSFRSHDPLTGQHRGEHAGHLWPHGDESEGMAEI